MLMQTRKQAIASAQESADVVQLQTEMQAIASARENGDVVELGEGAIIDVGVVIGYPLARSENSSLIIGPNAHIRHGTVIYVGSHIGSNLETGHHVVIREQNSIGDSLRIWSNSTIDYGCRIGNNVKIHGNVYVAQFTIIEDDVFLAPGVTIANDVHPGCPLSSACMRGPTIKQGAQIGVNSTILPFITIGERALIGAGSVVTKDVPPGCVVYGSPVKVKGRIDDLRCLAGLRDRPYR